MSQLRTAGCFIEYNGKFIILHRHPDTSQGDTWGLPAGTVESGESDQEAILREILEETGYQASPKDLEFLGEQLFQFQDLELSFPTFRIKLEEPIEVRLDACEH